ncbi:ABC transporter ATP-binding protein [bacterium]|nr:ABC transporter ATP-binding protein [bacterium]
MPHEDITNKGPRRIDIAWIYLKTLFKYAGWKVIISVCMMTFLGLIQGIGLLMIIPFLHLIGVKGTEGVSTGFVSHIARIMMSIGIPLTLFTVLLSYIAIVSLQAAASWYQKVLNAKIVHGFSCFLRNRLYKALADMDWLSFIRTRSSDIAQVITTDMQRVASGTQELLLLASTIIIILVHIGIAFLLSVPMSIFALICSGILFVILHPLNQKAYLSGKRLRTGMKDMFSSVMENLGGMKITKTYDLDQRNVARFHDITYGVADDIVHFTKVSAYTHMFYEIGAVIAISSFLYLAVEIARMATMNLLLIVFIFTRLLPKVSAIQNMIQYVLNSIPSFESDLTMQRRFEEAKEVRSDIATPQTIYLKKGIHFQKVSFMYDKLQDIYALRDVDITIRAQCMTAIVGPSGAGKSTLADMIMGLLTPDEGIILIDGEPLMDTELYDWRHSVGYVPQDAFLFNDTIRKNLLWARPEATEDELWEALSLARAEGFVKNLSKGMDTCLGDRGIYLSGGERQRISLARALLRKPSLLLLDEATSSLDVENEHYIQDAIEGLHGSLTIIVIAHRLSTIRRADKIIVLECGNVAEEGSWDELIKKPEGRFQMMALA